MPNTKELSKEDTRSRKAGRKKIVAGNWKMNLTLHQGEELIAKILELLKSVKINCEILLAPSFVHLTAASKLISGSGLKLAAQNCSAEAKGAFTGEVSAEMIRSIGASHIIIGHSERRKLFGETEMVLHDKIKQALHHGLIPIYCVGETLAEKEKNLQNEIVKKQIEEALHKLSPHQAANLVIAYEPVWAIGTGKTATPQQAQEMHHFIRSLVEKDFGKPASEQIRILYGGSCTAKNAPELFVQADIDGGLIGGASLEANDFAEIIKAAS